MLRTLAMTILNALASGARLHAGTLAGGVLAPRPTPPYHPQG